MRADGAVAGEHTRTIQIATPTIGGLMKFAVKTVTCLGCRTPLKSKTGRFSWLEHAQAAAERVRKRSLCQLQAEVARAVPETGMSRSSLLDVGFRGS